MMLKKSSFFLMTGLCFLGVFGLSFLLFERPSSQRVIPAETLNQLNELSQTINELLEKKDPEKSREIQKLLDSGQFGEFQLLYRDWSIKQYKTGSAEPTTNNLFFDQLENFQFSLAIPVGKHQVKGVLVATRPLILMEHPFAHLLLQILFSFAATFLILGLVVWNKIQVLVKPIDRLCQQFTRYRREQETTDIHLPDARLKQSPLERRIEILEDLWSRFQSIQEQLADKVEALKQSEAEKEKTIEALERAKEQERRLVELGHALAEFGHDIGNANGAIGSFVGLLLKTLDKEFVNAMDLNRCLTYIRRIKIASTTVSGLTNDILEFAKGKTELRIGQHRLHDCVNQLEVNLGLIADIPIQYQYPRDRDLILNIDDNKIIRVIVNLVKNAWEKLEEEKGRILVEFIPDEDSGMTIAVTDNGYPIPDSVLSNLFRPFHSVGKAEGTGLGLTICKKIIEAHGGRIRAENLPQKSGVRFSFRLPDCVTPISKTTITIMPPAMETDSPQDKKLVSQP